MGGKDFWGTRTPAHIVGHSKHKMKSEHLKGRLKALDEQIKNCHDSIRATYQWERFKVIKELDKVEPQWRNI